MNETELRDRLAELHAALEQSPSVDGDTRTLLRELAADIEALVDEPPAAPTPAVPSPGLPPGDSRSLAERLRDSTGRLEADHPRLTMACEQLMEAITTPFR